MSVSRKTLIGGVVGVIVAVGLIVAGMYAFGGLTSKSTTTNTISGSSTSGQTSSTTIVGSNTTSKTSSTTSSGTGSSSSTGVLQLAMIDPPHVPANVVDVFVNYSAIEVHISNAGNNSGWFNVTSSGSLNLTNIVNASTILGSVSLPNGTYNIVRFNVTSAVVTVNSSSGVLTNHTANVPSGKVQTVITGGVNVRPNTTSALLVDISPTVTSLNGSYTLIPSATAHPTTPANSNNSATTNVTQTNHTSVNVTKSTIVTTVTTQSRNSTSHS